MPNTESENFTAPIRRCYVAGICVHIYILFARRRQVASAGCRLARIFDLLPVFRTCRVFLLLLLLLPIGTDSRINKSSSLKVLLSRKGGNTKQDFNNFLLKSISLHPQFSVQINFDSHAWPVQRVRGRENQQALTIWRARTRKTSQQEGRKDTHLNYGPKWFENSSCNLFANTQTRTQTSTHPVSRQGRVIRGYPTPRSSSSSSHSCPLPKSQTQTLKRTQHMWAFFHALRDLGDCIIMVGGVGGGDN